MHLWSGVCAPLSVHLNLVQLHLDNPGAWHVGVGMPEVQWDSPCPHNQMGVVVVVHSPENNIYTTEMIQF